MHTPAISLPELEVALHPDFIAMLPEAYANVDKANAWFLSNVLLLWLFSGTDVRIYENLGPEEGHFLVIHDGTNDDAYYQDGRDILMSDADLLVFSSCFDKTTFTAMVKQHGMLQGFMKTLETIKRNGAMEAAMEVRGPKEGLLSFIESVRNASVNDQGNSSSSFTSLELIGDLDPLPGQGIETMRSYLTRGRALFNSDGLYREDLVKQISADTHIPVSEFANGKTETLIFNYHVKVVALAADFDRFVNDVHATRFGNNPDNLPLTFNDKALSLAARILTLFMHPVSDPYALSQPEDQEPVAKFMAMFSNAGKVNQNSYGMLSLAMAQLINVWNQLQESLVDDGAMDFASLNHWVEDFRATLKTQSHKQKGAAVLVLMDAIRKALGYIFIMANPNANNLAKEGTPLPPPNAEEMQTGTSSGDFAKRREVLQIALAIAAGRHAKWIAWDGGLSSTPWVPSELATLPSATAYPLFLWRGQFILTVTDGMIDTLDMDVMENYKCTVIGVGLATADLTSEPM